MSIWDFAEWLDPIDDRHRISLGEGHTPLIRSQTLGPRIGLTNLYFKLESVSPTGSYKDRFAAAAISHMRRSGQDRCVATSSGNTGAALAAYCAAAQIRCTIAVVESATADKLQQMRIYGAQLLRVQGFGTDPHVTERIFQIMDIAGRQPGAALQISAYRYSAQGMAGVETISHELADLEPDAVFIPAGGGGLGVAVARGFQHRVQTKQAMKMPAIHVVQPEGNDTIATPLAQGEPRARTVQCTTSISGLQVANVIDGDALLLASRASGGTGHVIRDEDAWQQQAELARCEGIFCEPAAAVSVAGALAAMRTGCIHSDAKVVCVITGSGFKDSKAATRMLETQEVPLITEQHLAEALGLEVRLPRQ